MKTIVIVGGGFAGISVANKLAKKLRRKDAKVILIEPKEINVYEPQFVFLGFQNTPQSKFIKPMNKVLSGKVNWLRTTALKIDSKKRTIALAKLRHMLELYFYQYRWSHQLLRLFSHLIFPFNSLLSLY